jgi:tRNA dimethylallyltransferase
VVFSGDLAEEQAREGVVNLLQEQLVQIPKPTDARALIIAGPTGVGKTDLSCELAERLSGEIISADSIQVYRGMDIGTAKISKEVRKRIPHHLIDMVNIDEPYHVCHFYEDARAALHDILRRGRVPIVVGGTGFYIHTLIYGPPSGPPSDAAIRHMLEEELEKFGPELLFEKLEKADPTYAKTITQNDTHKVIRALEIMEISGKPVSSFCWKARTPEPYFDFRCWFLTRQRDELYHHLDARCDAMLEKGLLEEVVRLDRAGIRQNPTAAQAIGYKQTLEFLATAQTPADYEVFREAFRRACRHLAKRQYTWFRKEPLFRWLDLSKQGREEVLEVIISDFQQEAPPTILA